MTPQLPACQAIQENGLNDAWALPSSAQFYQSLSLASTTHSQLRDIYHTNITPNTPQSLLSLGSGEQPGPHFLSQLPSLGMEKGVPFCSPLAAQLRKSWAHVTSMGGSLG